MRGKYDLLDWEMVKWLPYFESIIESFKEDKSLEYNFDREDLSPSNIKHILNELGWSKIDFEMNGWEADSWWYFEHKDYDFQIVMFYCGFTFRLNLSVGGEF